MIDLHSHILHGFDDGATDIRESLAMAQIYANAGFHTVVATPHFVPGTPWKPSPEIIIAGVNRLNGRLKRENICLEIMPGMEIALDPLIPKLIQERSILPLNGSKFLLIELPFQQVPIGWEKILFELQLAGYHILIAHPERCQHLIRKPHLAEELVSAGMYLQVNWGSLVGKNGQTSRNTAIKFACNGLIHCLAVDSHNKQERNAALVERTLAEVQQLLGDENVNLLCRHNPSKVINGEPLTNMQPVVNHPEDTKRRLWWPWRKRS